jgi:hypothetical protein
MGLAKRLAVGVLFTLAMLVLLSAVGGFVAGLELLIWLALLVAGWVLILRWRRRPASG